MMITFKTACQQSKSQLSIVNYQLSIQKTVF